MSKNLLLCFLLTPVLGVLFFFHPPAVHAQTEAPVIERIEVAPCTSPSCDWFTTVIIIGINFPKEIKVSAVGLLDKQHYSGKITGRADSTKIIIDFYEDIPCTQMYSIMVSTPNGQVESRGFFRPRSPYKNCPVTTPMILNIEPRVVKPGDRVTITGSGFWGNTSLNQVFAGNTQLPTMQPSVSSDRHTFSFVFWTPWFDGNKQYDIYIVNPNGKSNSSPIFVTSTTYGLDSISPNPAPIGGTVALRGRNFGTTTGKVDLLWKDSDEVKTPVQVRSWNNNLILITVPRVPASREYYIQIQPNYSSITPSTPANIISKATLKIRLGSPLPPAAGFGSRYFRP